MALRVYATFLVAFLAAPVAARATLGGPLSSVQADCDALGCVEAPRAIATPSGQAYLFKTPKGTVEEFIDASGVVAHIEWTGLQPLSILLGSHFQEFAQGAPSAQRNGVRSSQVRTPAAVVRRFAHARNFYGNATLRSSVQPLKAQGE